VEALFGVHLAVVDPNVAVVQRAWAAFTSEPATLERVESGGLDPVLEDFDPDIVWEVTPLGLPGMGRYQGHDGVVRFWNDWFEVFDAVDTEVLSFEAVDDKVITLSRQHATGVSSGTEATWEFAMVCTVRDGKVVRAEFCSDLDEARQLASSAAAARASS